MLFHHKKIILHLCLVGAIFFTRYAFAHDPVFSPGPHVLFKEGVEIHAEFTQSEQGDEKQSEQSIAVKYGLSGDWVVGIELPYETDNSVLGKEQGIGDMTLSTKYRFWRKDSLGVQETSAIIAKVKLDSGDHHIGSGTTDALLGFTYGYESLKWYRWASIRYRFNQDRTLNNQDDLQRGDRLFVDLAGGYRPKINDYREADTVWLLELNGEYNQSNLFNGVGINNTGGSQWFVSPGILWTLRNFAIKAGLQIPLSANLKGDQANSDYRARLEFEWHL